MPVLRIAVVSVFAAAVCASTAANAQVETAGSDRWAHGDLTVGSLTVGAEDLTLLGLTLGGGYMLGDSIGVGARLPIAHARTSGDSGTALSNLTGDFYWVYLRRAGEAPDAWTGRAWFSGSFSAPTSTSADPNTASAASDAYTVFWLPDPGLYHTEGMAFRAGTTVYMSRGKLFIDSELDGQLVIVGKASNNGLSDDDITNIVLRLGGGYRLSKRFSGFASFSNAWRANAAGTEDAFFHWFNLGLVLAGQKRGHLRAFVYAPIDKSVRDAGIVGFGISVASGL